MCFVTGLTIFGVSSGVAQPVNDACAEALNVGEDGSTPAWSGSNQEATPDGFVPCAPGRSPESEPKTIWFRYTPSASGLALVTAQGTVGVIPTLAWYSAGCGTMPDACHSFFDWFIYDTQARLLIPVAAGQPQLISLSGWAGEEGDMTMSIRLLDPPCELNIPPSAVTESEPLCTSSPSNDGCDQSPSSYDLITPGLAVTGQLWSNGDGTRDFDYYKFTVPEDRNVSISFRSQYPAVVRLFGPECFGEFIGDILMSDVQAACTEFGNDFFLPAGNYSISIGHVFRDRVECGSGYNGYWLLVSGDASYCDSIDFNLNGVFPEDQDVIDFFDVLAGGACDRCNDIDFNNNGVFPEDQDVIDFFNVLAGGECP
jgi:hypothetical protein